MNISYWNKKNQCEKRHRVGLVNKASSTLVIDILEEYKKWWKGFIQIHIIWNFSLRKIQNLKLKRHIKKNKYE